MTVELLDEEAPDVEDFITCWLQPLLRTSALGERNSDDPLPFAAVQLIIGVDDQNDGSEEDTVQIDILDDGTAAVALTARRVHRRMTLLARTQPDVIMSDGQVANADYCETLQKPIPMPYRNEAIKRRVARYRLGLSYVHVTTQPL